MWSHPGSDLLILSNSFLLKQKTLCKTNPAMPPSPCFLTSLAHFFKEFSLLRCGDGLHRALEHLGAPGLESAFLQPVEEISSFPF